jgi:hypothetical protein
MSQLSELALKLPSAFLATTIALVITYLPGYAILNGFAACRRMDWLSRLCIAPGVSIALYTLLFTFCYPLGVKLGVGTPWAIVLLSLAGLLINTQGAALRIRWPFSRSGKGTGEWPRGDMLPQALLAVCFIAALGGQLYVVRDLVAPTGSDSVHHTLIVQLLLENGGLFQSWMPYVDSSSFTYHFGFHAITAMYAWMRGISAEFAVITMGQVLGVAAVMALYALVRPWVKTAWGAVFAVIFAAFASAYPAGFVIFGRDTQLAGQIILITALVLLNVFLVRRPSRENLAFFLLLSLTIAGLGLAQYQEAIIFAILAAALVVYHFVDRLARHETLRHAFLASAGRAFAIAAIALLLFLPRGLYALSPGSTSSVRLSRLSAEPGPELQHGYNSLPDVVTLSQTGFGGQRAWVWMLAVCGIAVAGIWRRQALWLVGGGVLCIVAMDPQFIGIHRTGIVDPIHLSLSNYIYVVSLAALATGSVCDVLISRSQNYAWLPALLAAGITIYGVFKYPSVDPTAVLVFPQDLALMNCIRQQVPAEEHIAVRGTFYYDDTLLMGDDAGWWIPFYAQRQVNLLPLEASGVDPQVRRKNRAEFQEMLKRDMSTAESAQWLRQNGYRYFYIGAKAPGLVSPQENQLTQQLLRNPAFQTVCQTEEGRLLLMHASAVSR